MTKFFAPALTLGVAAAALAAGASPAFAAPAVYYPSCAAAIAAHAAPILVGEPGYRLGLDRDHDGTACDKNLPVGYHKKGTPAPVKPAPKPTSTMPAPATPAPATPAPAMPATKPAPGTGPVVQTDRVTASHDAASTYAVLALVGAAAGAGTLRVRSTKR